MARKSVFYSFHYLNDVFRVQQIRNIGSLDGNEPVTINEWEEIKRKGEDTVRRWIDATMSYRQCVIVLVGSQTAHRPWVQYEIEKAWNDGRGIFGIFVHNLKCPRNGNCQKGANPFEQFTLKNSNTRLSQLVDCYDPNPLYAYNDISQNIETWIDRAIAKRK